MKSHKLLEHTDLHWLAEILETTVGWLNTTSEHIQFGLQFKNIWDGYKTPEGTPSTPGSQVVLQLQPLLQV